MLLWLLSVAVAGAGAPGAWHLPAPTPAPWFEAPIPTRGGTLGEAPAPRPPDWAEDEPRLAAVGANAAIVENGDGAWLVTVAGGVERRLTAPAGATWVGLDAQHRAYALAGGRLLREGVDTGLAGDLAAVGVGPGGARIVVATRVGEGARVEVHDGGGARRTAVTLPGVHDVHVFGGGRVVVVLADGVAVWEGKGWGRVALPAGADRPAWRWGGQLRVGGKVLVALDRAGTGWTPVGGAAVYDARFGEAGWWTAQLRGPAASGGPSFTDPRELAADPARPHLTDTSPPPPEPVPPPPKPGSRESVAKKSLLLQMIGTNGNASGNDAVNDLLGDSAAFGLVDFEQDAPVWRQAARLLRDGLRRADASGWDRPPHVLLKARPGDEARLVPVPAGCDPGAVETFAGLVLLRCVAPEGMRVHTWAGTGWADEGGLPAQIGRSQVGEDGTLLLPVKGGARIRPPGPPGVAWRALVSETEAWRVGPAGAAIGVAWADGLLRLRFLREGAVVHTTTTGLPAGSWDVRAREGRVTLLAYAGSEHEEFHGSRAAVLDGPGAHAEVPVGAWPGAAGANPGGGGAAAALVSYVQRGRFLRERSTGWVALADGLARGAINDVWRDVPGPAQGLVPTALAAVGEQLWVGLPDGRTAHLDAEAGRWRAWAARTGAVTGIYASRIATWVVHGEASRRYDVARDTWRTMGLRGVFAHVADAVGQGWVATPDGLYLDGPNGVRRWRSGGRTAAAPLTALAADAKRGVWIGGAGVWHVTADGVVEDASTHVPGGTVRQILVDRGGAVWVRGDGGFVVRDPSTGAWLRDGAPYDNGDPPRAYARGPWAATDDAWLSGGAVLLPGVGEADRGGVYRGRGGGADFEWGWTPNAASATLGGRWGVSDDGRLALPRAASPFGARHLEVRSRSGFAAGTELALLADTVATMRIGARTVGRPDLAVVPRAAAVDGERWWMVLADGTLLAGEGDDVAAPERLPLAYVTAVARRAGALCVGGNALLCRADGGEWARVTMSGGAEVHDVTALSVDGDGVWAGTWAGVCRVGGAEGAAGLGAAACASDGPVRAVVGDGAGGAWILTVTELLHRAVVPSAGGAAGVALVPTRDERRASGERFTSLARDPRTGAVWAAGPEGLERFAASGSETALAHGPVAAVMVDAAGTVWARVGDGLSRIE